MKDIVLVDFDPRWVDRYRAIATHIRNSVGPYTLRIDHIGSTALNGIKAKDVIDIQITIEDLSDTAVIHDLHQAGYRVNRKIRYDNFIGMDAEDPGLLKIYAREGKGSEITHIHIREQGRFNQRFALLFRDYLRNNESARLAYERLKIRIQKLFPNNADGYYHLKDPIMDLIYSGAEHWASLTHWRPDDEYL